MFLISLPKGPGCLTYVFIITHELPTLAPIDSPILFIKRVFIPRFDQYILNSSVSLEMGLDSIPLAYVFDAFP